MFLSSANIKCLCMDQKLKKKIEREIKGEKERERERERISNALKHFWDKILFWHSSSKSTTVKQEEPQKRPKKPIFPISMHY